RGHRRNSVSRLWHAGRGDHVLRRGEVAIIRAYCYPSRSGGDGRWGGGPRKRTPILPPRGGSGRRSVLG
ncbi:hypothetical protein, partial [Candidatus Hakubella thermalkaliphila]|uniref:hypothetical protein n=1 Tax=Candidatus Hakubella thermalkaliphila TaxID=2754717 RepID=UPI001C6164FE